MDEAFAYGDVVARVQGSLSRLGYYPGPVDGMLTPSTSAAIRAFQRDIGVRATGDIEYNLMTQLKQAREARNDAPARSRYQLNP